MKSLMIKLWNDECGIVISTEMVVITSITLLATIVGLESLANAIALEFNDIGNALTSIVQSYSFTGFQGSGGKLKSSFSGSSFQDTPTTQTLSIVGASTTIVNQAAALQNSDINSLSVAEGIQTVEGQSTESVISEEPLGSLSTLSDESCNDESVNSLENADCDTLRDLIRRLRTEINQTSSSTRTNSSNNNTSSSSSTNGAGQNDVDELLRRDAN